MDIIDELKQNISKPWYYTMGSNLSPSINEAGDKVVYIRIRANWKEDRYDNDLFVHDIARGESYQLTRGKSVTHFEWIGNSVIYSAEDSKGKNQVWLLKDLVGHPLQLTEEKEGILRFACSDEKVVVQVEDKEKFGKRQREEIFGKFVNVEEDTIGNKILYFDLTEMEEFIDGKLLVEDKDAESPWTNLLEDFDKPLHITNLFLGKQYLLISGSPKPDLIYARNRKNLVITLKDHKITEVKLPHGASLLSLSPDEKTVIIHHKKRDNRFYTQGDLWRITLDDLLNGGTDFDMLTGELDQTIMSHYWINEGIVVSFFEDTRAKAAILYHESKEMKDIRLDDGWSGLIPRGNLKGDFATSVFAPDRPPGIMYKVGERQELIEATNLEVGKVETMRWKSRDGVEIQGVVRYPPNYDETRSYPLAFVIHGGPAWISVESAVMPSHLRYYPALQLSREGVIIVEPNYRGSIGRGQEFLELNVNNLGVGDLWDIESCIDHLGDRVDRERVFAMGWSQGGYISAMAATHSDRFKAVSVGAGISDWYSYWVTTDIRNFTEDYLSTDPITDRERYRKTSPMSAIDRAKTPTLIQIGQNDQRVPLTNATELYRALKIKGVETHLFVYPGMPHGIGKPKENLAVITQNYQWFRHHLFGTELDLFPLEVEEA